MNDYFEKFNEFLSSLNIDQIFALLHIIFFATMLITVYNIAIVYYSDWLIKYLGLETN